LPALFVQTLELLKQHGLLRISDILEHTEANPNTLKVRLRELVSHRHGKARATWYFLV